MIKEKFQQALKELDKKKFVQMISAGGFAGFVYGFNPIWVTNILSETVQSKIAQAGFFFTIAAVIHSSRVKKEIRESVMLMTNAMTNAIDNVAQALRQEIAKQSETIANHGGRIQDLESKITNKGE